MCNVAASSVWAGHKTAYVRRFSTRSVPLLVVLPLSFSGVLLKNNIPVHAPVAKHTLESWVRRASVKTAAAAASYVSMMPINRDVTMIPGIQEEHFA